MRHTKDEISAAEKSFCSTSSSRNQYHFLQKATSTLTQEAEALIQQTYGCDWTNEIDTNAISSPPSTSSNQPQEGENICNWEQDLWDLDSNGYKDLISALYDDLLRADNDSSLSSLIDAQRQSCSPIYKCPECEYLTSSRTQFWRHRKSSGHFSNMKHTKEPSLKSSNCVDNSKKVTCKQCAYSTGSPFNLKRHFIRTHTEQKNSYCKYCAKSFKDNDTMRTHIAFVHSNESSSTQKQYRCSNCDQTFGSSSDCLRHQRIVHQNQRQFECQKCKKSFQTRTNARRHYTNVCGSKKKEETDAQKTKQLSLFTNKSIPQTASTPQQNQSQIEL